MPSRAPGDRAWAVTAALGVGLVALVAWSAWLRYVFLTGSPFPMGIDGYFYPTQLRSLLEHGELYYPTNPLAFWLMAPLAAVTDPITGAKLGAALGGALVALPAYAVGARLGGGRAAGLAAAVVATTSAGSWYLSIEFVKNGWGITIALTAVWLVLRALDRTPRQLRRWPRWALAAIGVAAAALTHKMAIALVAVLAAPAIVGALRARPRPEVSPRELMTQIAARGAAVGIGVVVVLIGAAAMIVFGGLEPIAELVASPALWHAPALSLDGGRFELAMGHEPLAAGIAAVVAAAMVVRRARARARRGAPGDPAASGAAIGAIALAAAIALPWLDVSDPQGIGFRLRIVAFVPLALAAAIVVGEAAALLAPRTQALPGVAGRASGPIGAAALALAAVLLAPRERAERAVRAHPAMVAATMALEGEIPAGDTLVSSERHTGLMAAYYARTPFVLRPEAVAPARRWRLMPLAFIGRDTSLYRLLLAARRVPGLAPPRGLHPRDPNGLVVVPEATWDWILDRLPPGPRRYYTAWHTI